LVISPGAAVTVRWESGNSSDLSSNLSLGAGAAATLNMNGDVALAGPIAFPNGSVALAKSGTGTLTLSGDNSLFTGTFTQLGGLTNITGNNALGSAAVIISGGRVSINATITNDVTIGAGATLGGTGTIGGFHTTAPGSVVSPGNSPGTLTVTGNASIVGGTIFSWQVQDATNPLKYDEFNVSGTLDLTGASSANPIFFKVVSLDGATGHTVGGMPDNFSSQSIRIFNIGTIHALNTGGANISDLFSFNFSDFQYTDGSPSNGFWSIDWNATSGALTLTAVPEPSTYGFGIGALALAAAAIRRRRKTQATKEA